MQIAGSWRLSNGSMHGEVLRHKLAALHDVTIGPTGQCLPAFRRVRCERLTAIADHCLLAGACLVLYRRKQRVGQGDNSTSPVVASASANPAASAQPDNTVAQYVQLWTGIGKWEPLSSVNIPLDDKQD
jgi:hypothetical protein